MIGVYLDNFGGVTEFLLGIKVMRYMLVLKLLKKKVGYKMKMF